MDHPEWTARLHKITDTITLGYKTLSDEISHHVYDRKLAASGAFNLGECKSESLKIAETAAKGLECLRAGNYGGAILLFRQAVAIEPLSAKYQALLARSLARVSQYRREAVEHFEKAIEIDPTNITARFQFGQLYEEMGLPWRAQLQYQKIVEVDPEHGKARERLMALDAASGAKPKAGLMDRVLRRAPESPPASRELALTLRCGSLHGAHVCLRIAYRVEYGRDRFDD